MERLNDDLIEIKPGVRIERGRVRRTALATVELLDDAVTAGHYKVGAPDANGKPIVIGQDMTYIDWLSSDTCWYVYKETEVPDELDGKAITVMRYLLQRAFTGEAEAAAFAQTL